MALFEDISNFISRETGLNTDVLGKGTSGKFQLPWDRDKNLTQDEVFWKPVAIEAARWNKLYPYRLLVIDVNKNNRVVGSNQSGGINTVSKTSEVKGETGIEYSITHTAQSGSWEMVLPITPQQLTIQDVFTVNTSATMRGILEEHNGVKFKNITVAGTTGIWPKRPTKGGSLKQPSSLGSIFAGTFEASNQIISGIQGVANSFNGEHPNRSGNPTLPEDTSGGDFSTGYYQAMYLGQFIERYVQAKKNPAYKGWRLVFDIPKQNQSFVVTPLTFNFNQNKQRPNEMLFTMQFKAWKRIDISGSEAQVNSSSLPNLKPNTFQSILNTIESTRRTLSASTNLVKAVRSDAQRPFNLLRQTALAVKDIAGLAFAVGDLPRNIINDSADSIQDAWLTSSTAFNRGSQGSGSAAGAGSGSTLPNPIVSTAISSAEKAGAVVDAVVERNKANEGLSRDAVASGALGDAAAQAQETDPINNVFANPEENFDLFNNISIDELTLTPEQQDAIDNEIERVNSLTIDDFRESRAEILRLATDISNNFGSGNSTYSSVYGLPEPRDRTLDLTIEENEIMSALFESIQAYDLLTATKVYDDNNIENPLEYVGGLANEAGVDFQDFPSKILVPIPFNSTIEEIAARYMGDADKWVEIVTLNNLRSPYIDEEGFFINLLSNADGRQFNVDDSEDRLYPGQILILQSDTVPQFTRRVISVEQIGDNNFLVTVDGLANLDNLNTSDNARIQGFLPGTINSQNQIYIPVNQPAVPDDRTFEIPSLDDQNLTKLSKVDLLLTDNFDVAINSVGEFRLANGLTNLIQALKMKIRVQRGTLLRHLDFGLGLEHGVSVADIEGGAIINSMNEMIKDDDRFDFIESLTFTLRGPTLGIDMVVRLANDTGVLPIQFETRVA